MLRHTSGRRLVGLVLLVGIASGGSAAAQSILGFRLRGFADAGTTTLAAKQSFDAVVGRHGGPVLGGGIEIVRHPGWFVEVRASHFMKSGERVFPFQGQIYKLGIPVDIELIPVDLTGGFRLERGWFVTPYGGAGYTSMGYRERSSFSASGEDVNARVNGFHVMAGAEVRVWRWIGVAGEASWSRVANALGTEGMSKEFGETDLGGTTGRFKVIVGR